MRWVLTPFLVIGDLQGGASRRDQRRGGASAILKAAANLESQGRAQAVAEQRVARAGIGFGLARDPRHRLLELEQWLSPEQCSAAGKGNGRHADRRAQKSGPIVEGGTGATGMMKAEERKAGLRGGGNRNQAVRRMNRSAIRSAR